MHGRWSALFSQLNAKEAFVKGIEGTRKLSHGWVGLWLAGLLALSLSQANAQVAVDHLSLPGPVKFSGEQYRLAWSSHPNPQLYKQEYLPAGQELSRYDSMLMVDAWLDGSKAGEKAMGMVQSLAERKKTDPLVNYDLLADEEKGEYVLDFLLSAPDEGGQIIVEWNAYRYQPVTGGVQVTAISRRVYGDQRTREFLKNELKKIRDRDIPAIMALSVPATIPPGKR